MVNKHHLDDRQAHLGSLHPDNTHILFNYTNIFPSSLRYLQFESRSLTLPSLDPLPLQQTSAEPAGPRFLRSSSVGTLYDEQENDSTNNNNTHSAGSRLPALLAPPTLGGSCDNCK